MTRMLTIIAAAILLILVVVFWDAVEATAVIVGGVLLLAVAAALVGFLVLRPDSPQRLEEPDEPVHLVLGVLIYVVFFGVPIYWMWNRRKTTMAARGRREAEERLRQGRREP